MLTRETSSEILKIKIADWAKRKSLSSWQILVSWDLKNLDKIETSKNLFILGDYLAAYLYLIENKLLQKSIYVLSVKVRNILINLAPENENNIHLIDRYELYPKAIAPSPLPEIINDQFDFFYSGRISRSKNILLMLHVVSILQNEYNKKIGLKIYGEFDNDPNFSSDNSTYYFSYKKEVLDLLKSLPWIKKPEIIHGLDQDSWLADVEKTDVLINLSRFIMDDFSVASAQAQGQGVPLLIADIGGLSDITGPNVLKIPAHLIGSQFFAEDQTIVRCLANSLVSFLLKNFNLPPSSTIVQKNLIFTISPLPKFEQLRGSNLEDFMREPEGKNFIRKIEKVWRRSSSNIIQKKCLFLMTRQQDSWTSLARMMGNTEKFWVQFQDENFKVDFFDADKTLSKSDFVELMADYRYVIAPALMPNIVNLLKTLRETLGLKFQVIAYAHELPSIFFASLKLRSVDSFFLQSDIFITHCEADLKLTKLSFKNPNVLSIPADFLNSQDSKLSLNKKYPIKNFFYLGRISEQKNLHTLICALSLIQDQLRNKKIIFHMYGFHDHYGTPNLASDAGAYYDFLGSLLEEFKIGDLFKFYGFRKISHLNQYMKSMQGVGIFPSIHSDENFGLAPFDLLKGGVPVLLTEWGGFKDFIKNFPKLTTKIPVELGPLGPFVNPSSLAKIILNEIKKSEKASVVLKTISEQKILSYSQDTHISLLKDALLKNIFSIQKLRLSAYTVQAISQCQYSKLAIFAGRTWPQNGKIFSTYSDPLLILSSLKYGMKKSNKKLKRNPQLLPWVKKKGNGYIVHDPIKGTHKFLDIKELIKNGFIF